MKEHRMFGVLLRHQRRARGMTQADLAAAADISTRHLSFLETGRAQPGRDMVVRLSTTLGLSLRDRNTLLTTAGFAAHTAPMEASAIAPAIHQALERMLARHEPYPAVVLDSAYRIVGSHHGAAALFLALLPELPADEPPGLLPLCFDPNGLRPHLENWEEVARYLLARLQLEHVQTGREDIALLLSQLLAYPGVPQNWRELDLGADAGPVLTIDIRLGDEILRFLTTVTAFNAPLDVAVEELRIESYYPLDAATEAACARLVG